MSLFVTTRNSAWTTFLSTSLKSKKMSGNLNGPPDLESTRFDRFNYASALRRGRENKGEVEADRLQ